MNKEIETVLSVSIFERMYFMIEKNQSYEVLIEDLTLEGNGVCRIDNFAVFVPMTAVGDKVRIKIVKVLKNYGFGIIEKIISPSDDRVDVDCPVFKQCGGCSFRHISYEAELKLKEKAVKDAFSRLGGFDLPIDGILPSEKTEFYRNKAQYPLGVENGEVISGFYAKRSHRIVKCDNCKIQDERFSKIANWILEFVKDRQISVYDEKSGKGLLRHIYLRIADKTGEIMVCLVSSKKKVPFLKEFSEEIKNIFPDVKSVVLNVNPENTNVILGRDYEVLSGSETIKDVFLGNDFLIAPASFYQVNKRQAERLYEKAFEYAEFKGDETLLDLYCGIGSIGLSAYKKVKNLIGVEVVPQAIENAKKNAELNNAKNTEFICGDAKKAAKELLKKGLKPDVIIIDPPRQGCDKEVIESITEMAPEKVVMISCNPSTAARDAKLLCEMGYKLIKYTAVDLFPRTSHVECVSLLTLSE